MNNSKKLRQKLEQAQQILEAIQEGNVDAVVVRDEKGRKQVYSKENTVIYEQQQWLEHVLNLMPSPSLMISRKNGVVLFANKAMKELGGKLIVIGKQFDASKFICYDQSGKLLPAYDFPTSKALRGEKVINVQIDCVMPHGKKSLLVNADCIPAMSGQDESIILSLQDVTVIRETEKRKDDFINMASHELKTPITSMKLFLQTIKKQSIKEGKDTMLPSLEKMDHQIDKLTRLVRELLDISRIYAGKLQIKKEAFDLNDLLEDLADNFQQTTNSHKFILKSNLDGVVMGDRDRISQVAINLITNALKYSPNGGKIVISTTARDKDVVVSVKDNGIGIDAEHLEKIFERFYQVASPTEKTYPGLGIGLYISYEIIKLHGGDLWVQSKKGKGSTFYFSITRSGNN